MTMLQNWSDDELLKFIANKGQPTPAEAVADVGHGAVTGAVNAAAGIAGLPGDIQTLVGMGADAVTGRPTETPIPKLPGSQAIREKVEEWTGPLRQPKTGAGKVTRSLMEFAPAAAFPAGGGVQRAINVIAPTIGAEVGESLSNSPYGRMAGALAGGGIGARGITPAPSTPERQALVQVLQHEGIPLSAGQRTGNRPLQWWEQAAADTPFSAGRAARMNEGTNRAFTSAILRRMGATGDDLATPGVINREVGRIGQAFDDLASRNTLTADQQFVTDLTTTAQQYVAAVIPTQRAAGKQNVESIMQDVVQVMQQNGGQMPGPLYQATRSRLGKMADGARESDPQLSQAIHGIRDALDDAMGRSISPADQAAWTEARSQWRNWKAIERAVTGAGAATAEGYISPSQLRGAVAGQNRGAYARGQGDLSELAHAGEAVLRPLPNSGTPARTAATNLWGSVAGGMAGGGATGTAEGAIAGMFLPAVAGRTMLSRPMQAYLGNQIAPMAPQDVARALMVQQLLARPTVSPR